MSKSYEIEKKITSLVSIGEAAFQKGDYRKAIEAYLDAGNMVVSKNWKISTDAKIRALCQFYINDDSAYLVGSEDGIVYAINTEGNILWEYNVDGWVTGILLTDINNDGTNEIIVGANCIYILDTRGQLLNTIKTTEPVTCLQNGFLKSTNNSIIVSGHNSGLISAWDYDSNQVWTFKTLGKIIRVICDDIDGDGLTEVVVAAEDKNVYILDEYGLVKDNIPVNHWIVNLDTCKIIDNTPRLFVGVFEGDVHVYKHYKEKDSKTIRVKQHGILSLKVEYLIPEYDEPQFIIGTSDRSISIMDFGGNLIWSFDTGAGQRELIVTHNKETEQTDIVVGTETGEVLSYSLFLVPNLVDRIKSCYSLLGISNPKNLNLSKSQYETLDFYIQADPVNKEARLRNFYDRLNRDLIIESIELFVELCWNNLELLWAYETDGRIYALSQLEHNNSINLLASSEDKKLYCINTYDGTINWAFSAQGGIRGVSACNNSTDESSMISAASVDGNIYMLNGLGEPKWHLYAGNWNLYTIVNDINDDGKNEILVGSEDKSVYAIDEEGHLLWRVCFNGRVRAVYVYDVNNDGRKEIIAGSDDKNIYILSSEGEIIRHFETPHWILVAHAADIDNDGNVEILTGNEDGFLHVYDQFGNLKWQLKTGHWVAALDTYVNSNRDVEIVVGSADKNVYGVNGKGVILWQYKTGARVRTLLTDRFNDPCAQKIAFGSYDRCVYFINKLSPKEISDAFSSLSAEVKKRGKRYISSLSASKSDYVRAFTFLNNDDISQLLAGINDESDIVRSAAIAMLISLHFDLINNDIDLQSKIVDAIIEVDNKARRRIFSEFLSVASAQNRLCLIGLIKQYISRENKIEYKLEALRVCYDVASTLGEILPIIELFEHSTDNYVLSELLHAGNIILSLCPDNSNIGHTNRDILKKYISKLDSFDPSIATALHSKYKSFIE